jgi:lysophospholipase L1-like esterase
MDWTIEDNETYNLAFSGGLASFTITDFGYDEYVSNRGKFTTPTSNPISKENLSGKKITFLGDSITAGVGASSTANRYSTVLSNSLGMTENNMGISGTVLATGGHRTSRINHISSIPLDSDYVGVLLGINDFDQCKNDGTSKYYCLGDFNSRDTSTIYGALHVYCQELIKRFREQDTKIFFMTPVITSWNNSVGGRDWDQSKKNACGYSLPELVNAIKEVTSYYGIVTLDLNQLSGVTSSDFSDGIHPNDSGMKKMADTIEEFLIKNYSY